MSVIQLCYHTWDDRRCTVSLGPGVHRIGSGSANEVVIDDLSVASHHCTLSIGQDGKVLLQDSQSSNGTFLDGEAIDQAQVTPGQTLSLGSFMIKITGSDSAPSVTLEPDRVSHPLPDGSYSCLRHHQDRALYECSACSGLSCQRCTPSSGEAPICPDCGQTCSLIDWSGLSMTHQEALTGMIPERVNQAWASWQRWRESRKASGESGEREAKD